MARGPLVEFGRPASSQMRNMLESRFAAGLQCIRRPFAFDSPQVSLACPAPFRRDTEVVFVMSDRARQRDRPEPGSTPDRLDQTPPVGTPLLEEVRPAGHSPEANGDLIFCGRYEAGRCVRAAPGGTVYEALDQRLQSQVTVYRSPLPETPANTSRESIPSRLQVLADFRHPNVAPLCDARIEAGEVFLVTEPQEGDLLSDLLPSSGPLDVETAVELAGQICGALSEAHRLGFRHGGLCPERILITDDGDPVLLEFGWSDLLPNAADNPAEEFTAPEQRADRRAGDERADLWSLGAILYYTLTGETPDPLRPERLPERVRGPILQALEREPNRRPSSSEGFRLSLEAAIGDEAAAERLQAAALSPPEPRPDSAGIDAQPSQTDGEQTFAGWYRRRFDWAVRRGPAQSALLQGLLWSGFGFVWIPCWYLASARPDRKAASQQG